MEQRRRAILYKTPVEVVDGATTVSLSRVMATMAIATTVAVLLGSGALLAWTNNLPIGPVSDFLLYVAQAWDDRMRGSGLTAFADSLRTLLRSLEGLR